MSMKQYKKAWTMAEVVMAMVILGILAALTIQTIKLYRVKAKPYAYASILNLNKAANIALFESEEDTLSDEAIDVPVAGSNKSCVAIAESFSLLGDYTCEKNLETYPADGEGETGRANFQTSNMISYSGLEKDFELTYRGAASTAAKCDTAEVGIKDIMIDINGDDGDNEVGKDQFPIKLLQTGEVFPGTCTDIAPGATPEECSESFENPTLTKHPRCGSDTTNYINENYPFAYNIYMVRKAPEDGSASYSSNVAIAQTIRKDISFAEADCLTRSNILTRTQCAALGYEPLETCLDSGVYCFVRQTKPITAAIFSLSY